MLAYGNWCYPDEDPLAKRRKTNKADSSRAKEQTSTTTGSNETTRPNKPLLTVRRLVGDRLSVPKYSRKDSAQRRDVFRNIEREANNPYCVPGYSAVDPALMFGVRDVQNVWPGRMPIPNAPSTFEYRPAAIARPYPLRFRPAYDSFPIQYPHTGWVQPSGTSAFTPVRYTLPEFQTPRVIPRPFMIEQPSSIHSLSQMVSAVSTSTSSVQKPSANRALNPDRGTSSASSKSQAFKPTAQHITTMPQSSILQQELTKFQHSHIPVQTNMSSSSFSTRTAGQNTCVTTSWHEDLSANRAFSNSRNISTESSTSQASLVTSKSIMIVHPSSLQSSSSMVGSVVDSTTTLSPVDLSTNSTYNSARMASSESSHFEDIKPIAQPITTALSSSPQQQEPPKYQPPHIPVQTTMYSPSSFGAANQTFGSVTTTTAATTTSWGEETSANSTFSTDRIKSETSVDTTQPVMNGYSPSIEVEESPKFQPSHIPVRTDTYSPPSSLRGANQSFCFVTTTTTTTVTNLLSKELSVSSEFTNTRITSSELSKSQASKPTAQHITTIPQSSILQQELTKCQRSHIPVQTIMYSSLSSLRAADQNTCVSTSLHENFTANRAFSTSRNISTESSTSQASLVTSKSIMIAHPSSLQSPRSMVGSVVDSTTTLSPVDLSTNCTYNSARMASSESSHFDDIKPIAQPITTALSSSPQPQELPKYQSPHIPVQTTMYSPSSFGAANQTFGSVTTTTAAATTSWGEETVANSTFSTDRIKSETCVDTTQPVMNGYSPSIEVEESPKFEQSHIPVRTDTYSPSSSLQAENQSFCFVTTTTTTTVTNSSSKELSVSSEFTITQNISFASSKSQAFKPTSQHITTIPQSSILQQELTKCRRSHIPVQTIMYSSLSSLRAAGQNTCVSTSLHENFTANRAFSTSRNISTGSSTSQASLVTSKSIMIAHPSSLQSSSSMVSSVVDSTTTLSPVDLSTNSTYNSAPMASSESSHFDDIKPIAQPITTALSSSPQPQEPPKYQSPHIPVQTTMYLPSSSRAANQTFGSVTTTTAAATTSWGEETSANSAFSTDRIKSETCIDTTQPVMNGYSPSIEAEESSKYQPSHIPVPTVMYSPPSSHRAANQSFCFVTTTTTFTVTTSSSKELSVSSEFTNTRITSSELSKSQASKPASQHITTIPQSSILQQELAKCQRSHIPVQTNMYSSSSSLRAASQNACSVTTPSAEDLSTKRAFGKVSPSSMAGSVTDSTSAASSVDLSTNSTARMTSFDSSQFEDPKTVVLPITNALPSSLQSQESSKPQFSSLAPEVSPSVSHQSEETDKPQSSISTTQSITTSVQPPVSSNFYKPKLTSRLLLLSPPPSSQSSKSITPQTSKPTTQPNTIPPSSSIQSTTSQAPTITTHLLLLSPPRSIQSSEISVTSKSTTQPITVASSSSSNSTTTQAPKLTTHLLLLSKPQPLQSPESSGTKLLLVSPPVVCTATTPTITSPAVVSSSVGGGNSSEVAFDFDEAVVQSIVGAIKIDIPKTAARRKEDEIEEKDALLQRIYSVPAFGGKTVKGPKFYQEMLTKPKLCHLFKCMASDCSFTCNNKDLFDQHIELHEAKQGNQKEPSKTPLEEEDELYDWQQCAYCCESPTYPATSLSEHVITEHGYCEYQCAYCFYRALFQNYVDIHQTLAHRKILKSKPRLIFRCRTLSEGPTVKNALKKTGRRRCVRPYHCDQCGSEFLITEDFMNHLLKEHQSVTSYTCHICKNVCLKPDRLVVHYKLHSYSTYQCAYCLHGTETERKMIFHLCTFHFAQPACLYVRAWEDGKPVQSEDKPKKSKNRGKFTNQLDSLKMISYDIEATTGQCMLEDASDEESIDDDRLVIDESQDLNDIIAELGITTETEPNEETTPLLKELATIGKSGTQSVSVSTLLPNAKFSLEAETESETVLISSSSSSNLSSN